MNDVRNMSIDRRRLTILLLLMLAACAMLLGTSIPAAMAETPPAPAPRLTIPDATAQAKTQKLIRDVFGNYAAAPAAERPAIAAKMIEQGMASAGDITARYVLLKDGGDLAASAGDAATAMRAATLLASMYAVDAGEFKLALLRRSASAAPAPAIAAAVTQEGLNCANEAAAAGNYELAGRFMVPTEQAAHAARDVNLILSVQSRAADIKWLQQESVRAKMAEEKLNKSATDPDANFALGRYFCLVRGDWKNGLIGLSKGSNPAYQAAATADLANPTISDKQAAAGDLWWDLAEKETAGAAQRVLRRRAGYWYAQAVANPQFAGLIRALVEKKLSQIPPPAPGEAVAEVPPAVASPAVTPPAVQPPAVPPPTVQPPPAIAAGPSRYSALLFRGHAEETGLFEAATKNKTRFASLSILADPNFFGDATIVVFGGQVFKNAQAGTFSENVLANMRRFVENGGDLITLGNNEPQRMEFFTRLFGIRNTGGPVTGAMAQTADLHTHLAQAHLSEGYLRKFIFTNGFEVPAAATILVRASHESNDVPVAGILPVGKGRVIFVGSSMGTGDAPFDQALFDFIYNSRSAVASSVPAPGSAPAPAPPVSGNIFADAPAAGGANELLHQLNLQTDVIEGTWTRGADGITNAGDRRGARIRLPYNPPPQYDLRVVFTLHDEHGSWGVLLAHNDASGMWKIDWPDDCRFRAAGNRAHYMPEKIASLEPKLTIGAKHEVMIKVRNDSISTFIDGKAMGQISEDYSVCRLESYWSIGDHAIGIGNGATSVTFHSFEVHAVSGPSVATGPAKLPPGLPPAPVVAKPDTDVNIFTDASAAHGPRILLFQGRSDNSEAALLAQHGTVQVVKYLNHDKPAEVANLLANPATFTVPNVIVWGDARFSQTQEEVINDAILQSLRTFVENGGDLIFFQQSSGHARNFARFGEMVGVKLYGNLTDGVESSIPEIAAKLTAGGLIETMKDKKARFFTAFTVPDSSIVLLRNNPKYVLSAIVPLGKGRLILFGSGASHAHEVMARIILDYVFDPASRLAVPTPAITPAPAPSIPAAPVAGGNRRVILFYGALAKEMEVWKSIGSASFKTARNDNDIAAALASPDTFRQNDVIVWNRNRVPAEALTDASMESVHRFVEQGGDLIVFGQSGDKWKWIEKSFGLKQRFGYNPVFASVAPDLAAHIKAAGLSDDDLSNVKFMATAEVPENSSILIRDKKGATLAAVIPVGKGRLIFNGSDESEHNVPFETAFFDYIYHMKK